MLNQWRSRSYEDGEQAQKPDRETPLHHLMLVSWTVPQNNIKQQQLKVAGEVRLRGGMDLKG